MRPTFLAQCSSNNNNLSVDCCNLNRRCLCKKTAAVYYGYVTRTLASHGLTVGAYACRHSSDRDYHIYVTKVVYRLIIENRRNSNPVL